MRWGNISQLTYIQLKYNEYNLDNKTFSHFGELMNNCILLVNISGMILNIKPLEKN